MLTFLDSHIEATEGWLEPLLERVHQNPKAIACPVIEEVNDKTFQYKFVTRDLVGVFYWNLDFGWTQIKRPDWSPYDTPVMAGGLFSIRFVLGMIKKSPALYQSPPEKTGLLNLGSMTRGWKSGEGNSLNSALRLVFSALRLVFLHT